MRIYKIRLINVLEGLINEFKLISYYYYNYPNSTLFLNKIFKVK